MNVKIYINDRASKVQITIDDVVCQNCYIPTNGPFHQSSLYKANYTPISPRAGISILKFDGPYTELASAELSFYSEIADFVTSSIPELLI